MKYPVFFPKRLEMMAKFCNFLSPRYLRIIEQKNTNFFSEISSKTVVASGSIADTLSTFEKRRYF
jgi:hypothetical protein